MSELVMLGVCSKYVSTNAQNIYNVELTHDSITRL